MLLCALNNGLARVNITTEAVSGGRPGKGKVQTGLPNVAAAKVAPQRNKSQRLRKAPASADMQPSALRFGDVWSARGKVMCGLRLCYSLFPHDEVHNMGGPRAWL